MAGIVYISETRPDLLDDICNEFYTAVIAKIRDNNLNGLIVKKSANLSHAEPLVVDLSAVKDTVDEIAEAIASFKQMYPNKKVVILADKADKKSPIFSRLLEIGVYNIAANLEYETLRKCLFEDMTRDDISDFFTENSDVILKNNVNDNSNIPEVKPTITKELTANFEFKRHREHIFVAICGTEKHIGTTHQAILITKFLCNIGFKACYLEANKRRNIEYIAYFYNINANENRHLLQFEGIDMYYEPKLNEILKENYDFVIFDFGNFSETETSATFLTKDIKIVIGGAKSWEIPVYSRVFEQIEGSRGVSFIVNFAPPSEYDIIKRVIPMWKIYFSEYIPYPFTSGVNLDIYKEIFKNYLTVEEIQRIELSNEKKKKLFKFWR